jgi:protein TonB
MSFEPPDEFDDETSDDATSVPAGLASSASSPRAGFRFGAASVFGVSALLHGVALAALATCYAGLLRAPAVAVEGGTGAAAGEAIEIADDSLAASSIESAIEELSRPFVFTKPTYLPQAATDDSFDASSFGDSSISPASNLIGGSQPRHIGLAAASLAMPRTTHRPPAVSTPAASPGNGDGIPVGPPTPDPGNRRPDYPREALVKRLEGTVRVEAEVTPNGEALDVKVVTSSGHQILDDAAVRAVRRWRFRPAEDSSGRPIVRACAVTIPIQFHLR